jgi:hypothetical protein
MLLGVAWSKASATTAQIAVIKDAISKGWGIDAVPWAQSLAKSGERDPAVLAVAGWINVEGVWMDAWEYCKKLGADKDWKKRRTIHDQLSKDRNTLFPKTWPNNPYGGAIAVGHPLASSGIRLMLNLARTFEEKPDVRYGITTMCIGLGMGGTVIWENPHFGKKA